MKHHFTQIFLLLLLYHDTVIAKTTSGTVTLTGEKSEALLTKFAIASSSDVSVSLSLTIPEDRGMYVDERLLRLHLFADDMWSKVRKASTCSEKVPLATRYDSIAFNLESVTNSPGKGGAKYASETKRQWAAHVNVDVSIPNSYSTRTSFWYWTIDDCALETSYHNPSEVPPIDFAMTIKSKRKLYKHGAVNSSESHLSADQEGLGRLLAIVLVVLGLLFLTLMQRILHAVFSSRGHHTIHIAQLVVMAAVLLEIFSSLCQLAHRRIYLMNGIGNYTLDAVSGQAEALCDGLIAIVLIYVGSGWTLPLHVVDLSGGSTSRTQNRNPFSKILSVITSGLRSPNQSQREKFWWVIPIVILLSHVALAQWSRTFNDDFDSYHSLEHPSGKALMWLRFLLGFVFLSGTNAMRNGGRCPRSLHNFLSKFLVIGVIWFVSLPFISMFVSSTFPDYWKHKALTIGSATVQVTSLVSLVWLFSANSEASAYHQISRVKIGAGSDETVSLTDLSYVGSGSNSAGSLKSMLGGSNILKIGKTKIRLD